MYKTFQYRVKSRASSEGFLEEVAHNVNLVWNHCNDLQAAALKHNKKERLTEFSVQKLLAGLSYEVSINSTSVQATVSEFFTRRKQFKKLFLRFRGKKSLKWVPFKASDLKLNRETGEVRFMKRNFNLWYSRPLEGEIASGSFNTDSLGNWYLNITCKLPDVPLMVPETAAQKAVGIDLGLKSLATFSTGEELKAQKYFRKSERRIALAQSRKKSSRTKRLHRKVANQRKDYLHKVTKELAEAYDFIVVGGVKASEIAQKPNLGKSVHDAGWLQFKTYLRNKALAKGKHFLEVSEAYSTQTCSETGEIARSAPKGSKDLGVREWRCSSCGQVHLRDHNAAVNILKSGLGLLLNPQLKPKNLSKARIPRL